MNLGYLPPKISGSSGGHPYLIWRGCPRNLWWSASRRPSFNSCFCHCHVTDWHHSEQGSECINGCICGWHGAPGATGGCHPSHLNFRLRLPRAASNCKKQTQAWSPTQASIDNEPLLRTLPGRMGGKRGIPHFRKNCLRRAWACHTTRRWGVCHWPYWSHQTKVAWWPLPIGTSPTQAGQRWGRSANSMGASSSHCPQPISSCSKRTRGRCHCWILRWYPRTIHRVLAHGLIKEVSLQVSNEFLNFQWSMVG